MIPWKAMLFYSECFQMTLFPKMLDTVVLCNAPKPALNHDMNSRKDAWEGNL